VVKNLQPTNAQSSNFRGYDFNVLFVSSLRDENRIHYQKRQRTRVDETGRLVPDFPGAFS
jgi:hypothetical protein